ncbi:hypothetical protein DSM112329_00887 [Paraconexibacter sp. AEG42_29]|uniref:Mce/MlaD domain-containing protein n=1 Tax=Paraconexibacter sp. AEG42_29 TaxID=2997339 RepID=A0AAU7ARE0_9ACTN
MGAFSRFEQVPGRARDRHTRNGLIVLLVLGALLYYAYTSGNVPFIPKGGELVTAEFATAANVQAGKTPVRVSGVEVGKVEKVERLDDGRGVRVKMRITDDGVDLRKDARADIYWRTLLGFAFYIDLDQGSDSAKLGDQTIAMKDTSTQVELDQVLASVTPPSREGIQTLFKEFDKGFNGDTSAGRATDALGPSMAQVAPGLDALRGTKPGDLTDTVRDASQLMGALAKNEVQLGQVIGNADTTLAVTAARSAALDSTLRNGPSALDQTRRTMTRLRTTLEILDPLADKLRPGVRVLDDASRAVRPALRQLNPTLADARPLLADLRPALTRLRSASNSGIPLLKDLDPTLTRLQEKILPALESKDKSDLNMKLYETIGPAVSGVAGSSSLYDSYSYVQHFQAVAGGGQSAGFLPCSLNVAPVGINCNDLNKVVTGLFAGIPGNRIRNSSLPKVPKGTAGTAAKTSSGGSTKQSAPSAVSNVTSSVTQATGSVKNLVTNTLTQLTGKLGG